MMDFASIPPPRQVEVSHFIENLAAQAVDAAFSVHRELGPGLLESAYEACLVQELELRKLSFQHQVKVPLIYKGKEVDTGFRADLVLEGRLLIELKAVEELSAIHKAQVITYLKLLHFPLGLLMNFNEPLIKTGIKRVLNLTSGKNT